MDARSNKSDWTEQQLKRYMACSPVIVKRVVACVNACAGLNPEGIPKLVRVCELAADFDNLDTGGPSALSIGIMARTALDNLKGGAAEDGEFIASRPLIATKYLKWLASKNGD